MKSLFILFILTSFFFYSYCQDAVYFQGGDICRQSGWELVFSDEFDGAELDHSKWSTYFPYTSDGRDQCEYCRVSDDRSNQIYLDSNVVVSNGTCKLIAKRQTATWFGKTRDYTSGMIYSTNDHRYMYGKFESRCKIPYGMGFWPAFWMFGGTGTEIDVLEFGGQRPYHHHMAIAKWDKQTKVAGED
jgi:beta-glucanase (GH16 family)